ncbi:MAG TPA: hypothetical protein VF846_15895 [Thermoanaerobaculia bacterium]|jgi:hypothetical protein
MISGTPGLDLSSLVKAVLRESRPITISPTAGYELEVQPSRLVRQLATMREGRFTEHTIPPSAYSRMFETAAGRRAVNTIGNESRTLDAISALSVEAVLYYLEERWGFASDSSAFGRRFLAIAGQPHEPPTLLVLDPTLSDVSLSRRLTDEIDIEPQGLISSLQRLRRVMRHSSDTDALASIADDSFEAAIDYLWIAQPEVVLTRRPRMVPLCSPSPFVEVTCGSATSSVGVFCRDADGALGVSACFHGTGPVGTPVTVAGMPTNVKRADGLQDIVFLPLDNSFAIPRLCGKAGVRNTTAPSEAEKVSFEGAGTGARVHTRVAGHDAGILRKRRTVQLRVQTPPDTNNGDSGSALIDDCDRVVAFAFERTGIGEYPEFTDWIWADNALAALGLTPV